MRCFTCRVLVGLKSDKSWRFRGMAQVLPIKIVNWKVKLGTEAQRRQSNENTNGGTGRDL